MKTSKVDRHLLVWLMVWVLFEILKSLTYEKKKKANLPSIWSCGLLKSLLVHGRISNKKKSKKPFYLKCQKTLTSEEFLTAFFVKGNIFDKKKGKEPLFEILKSFDFWIASQSRETLSTKKEEKKLSFNFDFWRAS